MSNDGFTPESEYVVLGDKACWGGMEDMCDGDGLLTQANRDATRCTEWV